MRCLQSFCLWFLAIAQCTLSSLHCWHYLSMEDTAWFFFQRARPTENLGKQHPVESPKYITKHFLDFLIASTKSAIQRHLSWPACGYLSVNPQLFSYSSNTMGTAYKIRGSTFRAYHSYEKCLFVCLTVNHFLFSSDLYDCWSPLWEELIKFRGDATQNG